MDMNLEELRQKLMRAARLAEPDDRVPYAFEKRIMAQIYALSPCDPVQIWEMGLWRAVIPCLTLAIGLLLWTMVLSPGSDAVTLPSVLESAVLAPYDKLGENW